MFEQLIADASSRLNLSAASVATLVRGLLGLMTNEKAGGIDGFIGSFRKAGLGDTVSSWFGGREGRALTSPQVESALGINTLGSLATAGGLTIPAVESATAFLLPRLIGLLTPNGTLPSTSSLASQVSGFLDRPMAALPGVKTASGSRWLPWVAAAVALLALLGWLTLRGPAGSIDPQLSVSNRDGRITYSGVVRDESTRAAIITALQSAYGPANVSGALRVDPKVRSASWTPRLGALLASVNTPGLDFSLTGNSLSLGGWLSAAQRQAFTEKLRGILGSQWSIGTLGDAATDAVRAANVKARAALAALGASAGSATALVDAMNLSIINFSTGSAQIPVEDTDLIRQSADALKRAPASSKIEIGGHTDNTGDAAANLTLSQQRADAVRSALIAAGAPAAMLTTRGYGDTRPRAGNDSDYGRFQNRRIEYSIVN